MLYQAEAIAKLHAQLAELPPLPRTHISGRELVSELAQVLQDLRLKTGWTLSRIAQELQQRGNVELKASTLGVYLRNPKRKRKRRRSSPGRAVEQLDTGGRVDENRVSGSEAQREAGSNGPGNDSPSAPGSAVQHGDSGATGDAGAPASGSGTAEPGESASGSVYGVDSNEDQRTPSAVSEVQSQEERLPVPVDAAQRTDQVTGGDGDRVVEAEAASQKRARPSVKTGEEGRGRGPTNGSPGDPTDAPQAQSGRDTLGVAPGSRSPGAAHREADRMTSLEEPEPLPGRGSFRMRADRRERRDQMNQQGERRWRSE
jgi:hypothetical protein